MTHGLIFFIRIIAALFISILMIRFYLHMIRAPFQHPLTQLSLKLTDFIVRPAKKVIPSIIDYDNATLTVAWLVALLSELLQILVSTSSFDFMSPFTWLALVLMAVLELFRCSLNLLMGAILVQVLLSWIQPYNLLSPLLVTITGPFLKLFRRARIGNIDFAPLILLIVIQLIVIFPIDLLHNQLAMQLKLLF